MFTEILGFWTGLPAPVRRIGEYAGIVILCLWFLRVFWLNPHDNKVAAEATTKATDQVAKQGEARWKVETARLEAAKAALSSQLTDVQARNSELVKSRETIISALNTSLTQYKTIQEGRHGQVANIPASDLDGAIRTLSTELASTSAH